jgi:hypothetical protein
MATEAVQPDEQTPETVSDTSTEGTEAGQEAQEAAGDEAGEQPAADPETKPAEEPETLTVRLEQEEEDDEPPPANDPKAGTRWKEVKTELKAAKEEAAELRRQLEQARPAPKAEPEPTLRPRPTAESVGYDAEKLADAIVVWAKEKDAYDVHLAKKKAEQAKQQEYVDGIRTTYQKQRSDFIAKNPSYEAAEREVAKVLNEQQQAVLVENAEDRPKFILALHQNPKALERLAAVKSLTKFAGEVVKLEPKVSVMSSAKKPPPPEPKVSTGSSSSPSKEPPAHLLKEYERTKDRTPIIRWKQEQERIEANRKK